MKRTTSALQHLIVFAVGAIFALTALVGAYKCISRPPEITDDDLTSPPPAEEEHVGTDLTTPDGRKDRFYTILVGGLDNANGGSDTNLLVAMDAETGSINILSIPRDTLLNVSWSVKKLNNAYHHGGFDRTRSEVSRLLGIPIDYYITVDLNAFVELVDAIGGVEFEIPVGMDYDDPYQDLSIHFSAGLRLLNGEEALQVVRWRQNNDGTGYATADIGRIGTQQAFLMAAARQTLRFANLDKLPSLVEIFHKNVKTNLESSNILWLAEQALSMGSDAIQFHTLPGDGAGWYDGGSYYVLDDEATLTMVNTFFNPYTHDLTLDDMDILVP